MKKLSIQGIDYAYQDVGLRSSCFGSTVRRELAKLSLKLVAFDSFQFYSIASSARKDIISSVIFCELSSGR